MIFSTLARVAPRVVLVPLLLAALAGEARAQSSSGTSTAEGTVVAIDGGDLVVDLGTVRGATDGQIVELWRPVRIKHPVTGQMLVDRFRIGSIKLTQVQPKLSLARVEGSPLRDVTAGDVVVMRVVRPVQVVTPTPAPAQPAPAQPAPKKAASAVVVASADTPPPLPSSNPPVTVVPADPDVQALADLFTSLEGTSPAERARAYRMFLVKRKGTRFAAVLREEIAALSRQAVESPRPYEHSAPAFTRVRPGAPQRYTIELDPRFVGAVIHVRRKGGEGYRSIPMQSVGARYWSATLPGDAVTEPGLQYFVEGVSDKGAALPVIGTAESPRDASVDPRPLSGKAPATLAQIMLQSEYASFNAKAPNDYVFQTEGTFGWRMRDVGIRAIRSGFGVLRGEGGTLQDLDQLGKDPKAVGLTYGWLELEAAFDSRYSIIGRPILGLRDGGLAGGAQGFVRIGNDLSTNLSVGGEILGTVGLRGIVQLDWRTIKRVPILLRTEVTNQPAGVGSDVGARAIAQVGYELLPAFVLAVRGSYQGRTINHAGPGAGLAVSYQW